MIEHLNRNHAQRKRPWKNTGPPAKISPYSSLLKKDFGVAISFLYYCRMYQASKYGVSNYSATLRWGIEWNKDQIFSLEIFSHSFKEIVLFYLRLFPFLGEWFRYSEIRTFCLPPVCQTLNTFLQKKHFFSFFLTVMCAKDHCLIDKESMSS